MNTDKQSILFAYPCLSVAKLLFSAAGVLCGRLLGWLVSWLDCSLHRAGEDVRIAAFQARHAFYGAVGGQVAGKAHQQLLTKVGVGDFAAAELYHGLHPIAF